MRTPYESLCTDCKVKDARIAELEKIVEAARRMQLSLDLLAQIEAMEVKDAR